LPLGPLIDDNPTSGQSWNRHSTLEVDRIDRTGAPHGEETRPYNAFVKQLFQLFRQVFHSGRRQSIRCPCYGCSTGYLIDLKFCLSGTDLVSSLRTDLEGSSGTDLVSSLRTNLDGTFGNDLTMATTIEQQVALDEALVPSTKRLRIGRSNFRLPSDIQSKESTLQVVYDILRSCPFFKAFLVTADVPEIYMLEF
nr:hypothetical protein [Tanacetum cinerariifolium]